MEDSGRRVEDRDRVGLELGHPHASARPSAHGIGTRFRSARHRVLFHQLGCRPVHFRQPAGAVQRDPDPTVGRDCAVTRDHVTRSGGGLYFGLYDEFEATLDLLLTDRALAAHMGANGRAYVRAEFSAPSVLDRFEQALDFWRTMDAGLDAARGRKVMDSAS